MKKELFSSSELSELEALEVRGGNGASLMTQKGCTNNEEGCGAGAIQMGCTNNATNCGVVIEKECSIISQGPCSQGIC